MKSDITAEIKQLEALKAHCQMTIEQCDKRLKMLRAEEAETAVVSLVRKKRAAAEAVIERAVARRMKRYVKYPTDNKSNTTHL